MKGVVPQTKAKRGGMPPMPLPKGKANKTFSGKAAVVSNPYHGKG